MTFLTPPETPDADDSGVPAENLIELDEAAGMFERLARMNMHGFDELQSFMAALAASSLRSRWVADHPLTEDCSGEPISAFWRPYKIGFTAEERANWPVRDGIAYPPKEHTISMIAAYSYFFCGQFIKLSLTMHRMLNCANDSALFNEQMAVFAPYRKFVDANVPLSFAVMEALLLRAHEAYDELAELYTREDLWFTVHLMLVTGACFLTLRERTAVTAMETTV